MLADLALRNMRQKSSNVVLNRQMQLPRKNGFRTFYLTILCISLLAVLSLVADQIARYRHGVQYGTAQKRALEQLDVTRLVKRDEEVITPYDTLALRRIAFQGLFLYSHRTDANMLFHSVASSIMPKTDAPS